ncbi:metallophosphoesterase [Mucilaginibacter limnophilus]|uniref:Metallophosphoesterase n=1 Tax=Mucilaginibacter limnophilus TaxID=1932778 RepID=A0A437MSQ2_9SPHI|nr:metallophosphoesterase [Mucilaginibacter limnophilus]RVU00680.1 metallophosphoesterase [Mucilaginibacter limnophilus]
MKRRNFLTGSVAAATMAVLPASAIPPIKIKKPVLTVAHITDVHIHDKEDAPARATRYLKKVMENKDIDFILNGGDSIFDASYDNVTRDMVTAQWTIWDEFIKHAPLEVYSCIGNHDPWWKAPSQNDEMYGKPYVVKRLKIPNRYYSFSKKGWHFIVLDGNNEGIKLDTEQMEWLKAELTKLKTNTPVILMSHYPMLSSTCIWSGGGHGDYKELKALFYQHKDKVRMWLSGHQHLRDSVTYNGVTYLCNGAISGYWWGTGDKESAGKYYYQETPPGYALLKLYDDGAIENEYIPLDMV